MSSQHPVPADQPPQYASPLEEAASLRVFLFDSLTPRVRRKIESIIANTQPQQSITSEVIEFTKMWLTSCGDPVNRVDYLKGSYQWLQFLVDDLQLDYTGKPYRLNAWMSQHALHSTSSINVPEELLLDREYVERKLRERLQNGSVVQNTKRAQSDLAANLQDDKKLVESLFRLTGTLTYPAYFSRILTPQIRERIENGMSGGGWFQGLRSILDWDH